MEQTIEFVSNPAFGRTGVTEEIQASRPASLSRPAVFEQPKPGIAYVSGLAQSSPLTAAEEHYLFTWMNLLKWRAERNRRQLDLRHPNAMRVQQIELDLNEAIRVRNCIVQANLRLVVAIAKKLTCAIEQMSELIAEGMIPMIRSVELFDIGLGNRFSTYATWAVRNQMLRWLKRRRASREFSPEEDAPSLENLPDKCSRAESTDSKLRARMDAVNRLLSSLSERDRSIVVARFGLDGQPSGQSLADIAKQLGLSKERVRQIVLGSLSRLRGLMTPDEFDAMI